MSINPSCLKVLRLMLVISVMFHFHADLAYGAKKKRPQIFGTPATQVIVNTPYSFVPQVKAPDRRKRLSFIITNKPAWARYNSLTGALTGTPTLTDVGTTQGIVISVRLGNKAKKKWLTAKLPAFNITVLNAVSANPGVAPTVPTTPGLALSGSPPPGNISVGEAFSFTPQVNNVGIASLTFSIANKPVWASFDTRTGTLTGTPTVGDIGMTSGILITVSDGVLTVAMPTFDLTVIQPAAPCDVTLASGENLACQLSSQAGSEATWSLTNAPVGMAVQKRTGIIHWTPASDQLGYHTVTATATVSSGTEHQSLNITVTVGAPEPSGIYVSPVGNDTTGTGSIAQPLKTLHSAARDAVAGTTIYLRGGDYFNTEFDEPWDKRNVNSLARITTAGTLEQPIRIRPHGNEYPRLLSDVNAIVFTNTAKHWVVEGLELEGLASDPTKNSRDISIANWWIEEGNRLSGRGIANGGSQHIVVRDCVIHDFPGAGIASKDADWITVQNNIIYNNGWWTTGGVHGVANSNLETTDPTSFNAEKMIIEGNLVFGNQSLIISHVFDKGLVVLEIDEGNGLHLQNDARRFQGKARVENNLVLFNGKGGLGLNTFDNVSLRNNAFFQNARTVNTAELVLQTSTLTTAVNNLFQPRPERRTIKDSYNLYANVGDNATTGTDFDGNAFPSVERLGEVFRAPGALDFRPAEGMLNGMGVPDTHLTRMFAKVNEYGIKVISPTQEVDEAYIDDLRRDIFDSWPASMSTIRLEDKARGTYTYDQRCHWPGPPRGDVCP